VEQTLPTSDPYPAGAPTTPPPNPSPGCLASISSFFAGFVLACVSPAFYANAIRRKAVVAVLFIFLFGSTITCLQTASLFLAFVKAGAEIPKALERSQFPDIRISRGIAEISGPQPFVIADSAQYLFVLDTSGVYTTIDPFEYEQGMLLTRTKFVVLNNGGRLQEVRLSDLQRSLGVDPIELNSRSITAMWATFSVVLGLIIAACLFLWNTVIQLAYLMLLAGVMWGITALIRPGAAFGPVFITGLYALVPATYGQFLLSQARFDFCGLFTLLLLISWATALITATSAPGAAPASGTFLNYLRADRPVRAWRALIGLPLLIDFALEAIFGWHAWGVTWVLALVTFGVLVGIGLRGWLQRGARPPAPGA
jgi:hypothetical protein